jgi:LysM repeat protein
MTPEQYISAYRDYAIIEMHRSSVPASITLAQGMLESSYGNSRLATKGNNHFGIKCKGDWTGSTIYADDDAPNECFRAYNSALESFQDHSKFLRKNWRYHNLFDLQPTDYEGWAKGLRKAGYATNPSYHKIIINMVEKYKLDVYDLAPLPGEQHILYTSNQVPMVYAEKDQSLESIAKRNDLSMNQVYRYNDMKKGGKVNEGDVVYLKPKRRRGTEKYHVVENGENLYKISQTYGIKLKHLYRRNRLETGTEVAAGEKVYLQGKLDKDDELKTASEEDKKKEMASKFVNPNSIAIEKADPIEKENIEVPNFHIIKSGDNIYRIAEKYHVFEEDLLKWNGIKATKLALGQKIYLSEESAQQAGKYANSSSSTVSIPVIEVDTAPQGQIKKAQTKSSPKIHVVVKGDTVYRICQKYGVTAENLYEWNRMKNNDLSIGQKIKVAK